MKRMNIPFTALCIAVALIMFAPTPTAKAQDGGGEGGEVVNILGELRDLPGVTHYMQKETPPWMFDKNGNCEYTVIIDILLAPATTIAKLEEKGFGLLETYDPDSTERTYQRNDPNLCPPPPPLRPGEVPYKDQKPRPDKGYFTPIVETVGVFGFVMALWVAFSSVRRGRLSFA